MIEELLVSATPFGVRTAAIAGGKACAFNAESESAPSLLGNIYAAAEGRRGGAARFVAIAKEQNAFLQKSGGAEGEDNPMVQVTRAGWCGKAPRVSAEISLAGRYMVYFPLSAGAKVAQRIGDKAARGRLLTLAQGIAEDGGGVTIRSAAKDAADDAILAEARRHREKWAEISAKRAQSPAPALLASGPGLAERQMRDILPQVARIFTDDRATLARLRAYAEEWTPEFTSRLELVGGALFARHDASGALALTAIDVDSGVRGGAWANALSTACMEAAGAAAREIRLRNLAGLIVIDFPRLDAGDAGQALMAQMEARMRDDPVPHKVTGLSQSGLMEITRRRGEAPILDALTEALDGGYGGRRRRLDALAFDIAEAARLQVQAGARAVTLKVAPALAAFLDQDNSAADGAENTTLGAWLGIGVTVRSEPERGRENWEIEAA